MTHAAFMGTVSLFACVGALAGFLHLRLLAWNVRALAGRSRGLLVPGLALARGALISGAFAFCTVHGAQALIAALAGFLLSRSILLIRPELFAP